MSPQSRRPRQPRLANIQMPNIEIHLTAPTPPNEPNPNSPTGSHSQPQNPTTTLISQPPEPPSTTGIGPTPGFLTWTTFTETTLRPRKTARKSRLDKILAPLRPVSAGFPGFLSVDGLGGVIESAHGVFHSARRLDVIEAERTLYLYLPPGSGEEVRVMGNARDLERYENELFDLSKYNGACGFFTVLAWTEEARAGSVTLYRVLLDDNGSDGEGVAVGVRPVAAMREIPSPVLVKMRTDARLQRKVVLTLVDADDRTFDWRADFSRRGPRYVRLGGGGGGEFDDEGGRYRSAGLADGDGVRATLPQFFALLHARRSILEDVDSGSVVMVPTQKRSGNGYREKPTVVVGQTPRSSPHDGDRVHVAVLVPNDALWAEDEMVWTDGTGLAEFRQRQYWDVIGRVRNRRL